ncbi:MAG: hypothetical protein FJ050_02425 [Cyanobacteria bacterium M_surface_7_m2_040]|nr:hypothetical protein [Cyanobacteria bacterium K_Offshore_0m_m2_072]MBM5826903.1 hypothetical protein [Cyanobacteria bacterium M_surface_7_m2_040]
MIVLKISNAPELVATKLGKFLESLTPDAFDQATVEAMIIKKMVENLKAEGLKGEIASVKGIDIDGKQLSINETMHVRHVQSF